MRENQTINIPEFLSQTYYEKTIKRRQVMSRVLHFLKISIVMLLAALTIVALVACGENESGANTEIDTDTTSESASDLSSPAAVLDEITRDFEDVAASLRQKQEETFEKVGTTYEDYRQNKDYIDEWVTLVLAETDALFTRTKDNSIAYFKLIAADPDHKYSEFCDEALEEYYDRVYDEAMEIYYDEIYDEAMEELYDTYYDGIIDDAYDDLEYSEWSNASSECYKTWSDACAAIYKKWSEESSYLYGLWSEMNSAFCWNDNFDVDSIVEEYEKRKAVEDGDNQKEDETLQENDTEYEDSEWNDAEWNDTDETDSSTSTTEGTTSGLRPEFKEAMDNYEAFYDEYGDFMVQYQENPSDLELIVEYGEMLIRLSEMEEAFEEWEGDLNDAEMEYYLEVSNRITQKLLE